MTRIIEILALALSNSLAASILIKVTITTSFALVIVQLAHRSRAAVRHVLLASAFAVLLALPIASVAIPAIHIAMPVETHDERVVASFNTTIESFPSSTTAEASSPAAPAATRPWMPSLSALLLTGWLIGVTLFLVPVVIGLWQMRSMCRSGLPWRVGQGVVNRLATEVRIRRHVDILLHEAVPGPMTCGTLCPAVMLPLDAQTWTEQDLSRALVHELEHVRRGDWISQCLARAVCAFYWFHPLVWIAQRRFVLEAERACDDAVLQRTEATAYADQLVALAQRLSVPNPPLLGMANRNDLSSRVAAVLDNRQRRGRAGAIYTTGVGAVAALLITAISPLRVVMAEQTSAQVLAKFEVASIKLFVPGVSSTTRANPTTGQRGGGPAIPPASPDRFTGALTAEQLIRMAYLTFPDGHRNAATTLVKIEASPAWAKSDIYVIEAKAAGNSTQEMMRGPMLQALLEDRFKLKVHRETREGPVYLMTVAKSGFKLHELEPDSCDPIDPTKPRRPIYVTPYEFKELLEPGQKPSCGSIGFSGGGRNTTLHGQATGMSQLAAKLSADAEDLDRPVIDKTGIPGIFTFHLRFAHDQTVAPSFSPPLPGMPVEADEPEPTLFTAIQEQLGLKLDPGRGPSEYLVIDHIEKPTENDSAEQMNVQAAPPKPSFEVASVKPNRSEDAPYSLFPLGPGDAYVRNGGFFSAKNQPLIAYVRFAFKLGQVELSGLPGWVYDERFDIEARVQGTPTKDQMRQMMQSLLADRFKMASHTETQPGPVFDLLLAKPGRTGPQLHAHSPNEASCSIELPSQLGGAGDVAPGPPSSKSGLQLPDFPCGSIGPIDASASNRGRVGGRAVTIERIAAYFANNPYMGLDRPVFDKTGLSGAFDFSIEWTLPRQPGQAAAVEDDDAELTFSQALEEQLGFALKPSRGPVSVVVIDHIERPSPQ